MRRTHLSKRQPTSVVAGSDLIHDYLETLIPPLRSELANAFEVVQPPADKGGKTELVSVGPDQELAHFFPAPASHSGWSLETTLVPHAPQGTPIDKLIAFYQDELLFALAHYSTPSGSHQVIPLFSRGPGSLWGPVPLGQQLQAILAGVEQTAVYRDSTGRYYLYGIATEAFPNTPTFFLASEDPTTKKWQVDFLQKVPDSTTSYRILDGFGGNQMTVVRFDESETTFQGGNIVAGEFQFAGSPESFDLGLGTITASEAISVASKTHQQGFLLLTAEQQLVLVTGYDTGAPKVTSLSGQGKAPAKFSDVVLGVDLEGNDVVFGVDAKDNSLWLARQSPPSPGQGVSFQPWVALGNVVSAIGCPAVMSNGPEVFVFGLDAVVSHLAQSLSDRIWKTVTLATPTPRGQAPVTKRVFAREFTVRDENDLPISKATVRVTADRKAVVAINGLSYHIDTVNAASVVTNLEGKILVSSEAVSLSSLELTLELPDAAHGTEGPYRADLRTHQRLAGLDPTFPVSGAALRGAGLLPASVSDKDADTIASHLAKLGNLAVEKHGGASVGGDEDPTICQDDAGLMVDFSGCDGPTFRPLTQEQAKVLTSTATDGTSFWGDVAHFFEQVADDIVSLAITIVGDVAQVIINGVEYLLHTLGDVLKAIEVFLVKIAKDIAKAIEKVIDWLRMLFDWKDILDTQTVIRYYLEQTLGHAEKSLEDNIPQELVAKFSEFGKTIEKDFAAIEALFAGGKTSNGMVPATFNPLSAGGKPLEAAGLHRAYSGNSVRCNYAKHKVAVHLATGGTLPTGITGSELDLSQLVAIFEKNFPTRQLETSFAKFEALQAKIHDSGSFLDVAIAEVLAAVEELIQLLLAGFEAVLTALLDLAGEALTLLSSSLEAPLDVPVLSWLYHELTGEDLTVLNLLSLLIALPATILYKILLGGKNLNPPFTADQVKAITSTPIPWPKPSPPEGSCTGAELFDATEEGSAFEEALAALFAMTFFVYMIEDIGMDLTAASAVDNPEILEEYAELIGLVSLATIITSILAQGFGVPAKALVQPESEADRWSVGVWSIGWIPVAADLLAYFGNNKKLLRFFQGLGPWLSLIIGVEGIIVGGAAILYMNADRAKYNDWNEAEAILPSFAYLFQPLVLVGTDSPEGLVAQAALALVDTASDGGTAVCKIAPFFSDRAVLGEPGC